MKKVFFIVYLALAGCLATSCGGGSSDANVSPEMKGFMGMLNGSAANVKSALTTYGKPGLDTKDMDMYDLKDATVKETNGNCYLIACKAGMTTRKYNVCWESGKISSIEDKGME